MGFPWGPGRGLGLCRMTRPTSGSHSDDTGSVYDYPTRWVEPATKNKNNEIIDDVAFYPFQASISHSHRLPHPTEMSSRYHNDRTVLCGPLQPATKAQQCWPGGGGGGLLDRYQNGHIDSRGTGPVKVGRAYKPARECMSEWDVGRPSEMSDEFRAKDGAGRRVHKSQLWCPPCRTTAVLRNGRRGLWGIVRSDRVRERGWSFLFSSYRSDKSPCT